MDNATGKVFYTNYYFLAGANGNSTSFVSKVTFSTSASATSSRAVVGSIEYTYDTNGFISSVTSKNAGGAVTGYEAYTYDALGQLLTVSDGTNVTSYTYDKSGNILTEKYNGTTVGTYTYGDSGWKDLLTAYNGETITYDGIGNPTKYIGWDTLTWSMGRRLMSLTNDENSVSYTYNADGQRISKTVNGVTTTYYYDDRGALVLSSCSNGTKLYFYTNADGSIDSFEYNGNHYYYVRNAQNDIVGIVDSTGAFVARYTYDAWGNITAITDGAGNDVSANATHIANLNPLRYRSYFYDAETGWYWLNTRYYNPVVGRFINADGLLSTGQGVLGHNMFAYCGNNPVNRIDANGMCYYGLPCGGIVLVPCHEADKNRRGFISCDDYIDEEGDIEIFNEWKALALAQTIVGEAGGRYKYEDWQKGQEAVLWTIINRYNDPYHPNNWLKIVTQKGQYTGYLLGKTKYDNGTVDTITWDYAYTISKYAVSGQFDKIPYPEGFTDKHMFFRSKNTSKKDNWEGFVYVAGNYFFYYK